MVKAPQWVGLSFEVLTSLPTSRTPIIGPENYNLGHFHHLHGHQQQYWHPSDKKAPFYVLFHAMQGVEGWLSGHDDLRPPLWDNGPPPPQVLKPMGLFLSHRSGFEPTQLVAHATRTWPPPDTWLRNPRLTHGSGGPWHNTVVRDDSRNHPRDLPRQKLGADFGSNFRIVSSRLEVMRSSGTRV